MRWQILALVVGIGSTAGASLALAVDAPSTIESNASFGPKPALDPKPAMTGSELAAAVRLALREAARQQDPDEAVIRKFTGYYQSLAGDTSLPDGERRQLRRSVLGRLKGWQKTLAQQALPGQGGAQPNGFPPAPTDHSQELLELIQDTISPDSWDVRGGPGVIRYWRNGQAMVIRQSGEVHGTLGQLLVDLR
jgi:hypothetical protein